MMKNMAMAIAVTLVASSASGAVVDANDDRLNQSISSTYEGRTYHAPAWGSVTAIRADSDGGAADVITCSADKQHPHKSTHRPGTINVVAVLKCSRAVSKLSLEVRLYRSGKRIASSGWVPKELTSKVQANSSGYCRTATYKSWRRYYVYFPPGYHPPYAKWPTATEHGWGPSRRISC